MGLYFTGTQVQCLSDPSADWVKVTIGSETGYIMGKYLTRDASAVTPAQPIATMTQTTGWVNLRKTPSLEAEVIRCCYAGKSAFTVLGETASQWYYVETGGQRGYIKAEYLALGETETLETVLSASREVLLGKRGFFHTGNGRIEYLSEQEPGYTQFSVVLMDGDAFPEVVLSGNDSTLVLHARGGMVFGYDFVYRAMKQ